MDCSSAVRAGSPAWAAQDGAGRTAYHAQGIRYGLNCKGGARYRAGEYGFAGRRPGEADVGERVLVSPDNHRLRGPVRRTSRPGRARIPAAATMLTGPSSGAQRTAGCMTGRSRGSVSSRLSSFGREGCGQALNAVMQRRYKRGDRLGQRRRTAARRDRQSGQARVPRRGPVPAHTVFAAQRGSAQ